MVEMSIASEPKFQLEDIEIRRGGVSYTYDTVQELKKLYPNADLYFIIGGDMVEYLPKWYKVDELVKMIQFVSVERKGYAKKVVRTLDLHGGRCFCGSISVHRWSVKKYNKDARSSTW